MGPINSHTKMLAGIILATIPVVASLSVLTMNNSTHLHEEAHSASHVCSGNHYLGKDATFSESGSLEYWVCCECHEHYFTKPSNGVWKDMGIASNLSFEDDRYIPAKINEDVPTQTEIESTVIVPAHTGDNKTDEPKVVDQNGNDTGLIVKETGKNTNEYNIIGYTGTAETLIIPEGIISLDTWNYHPFDGKNNPNVALIETLVIPSTVTDLSVTALENMPKLTNIVISADLLNFGIIKDCKTVKNIYISKEVTKIHGQAFINVHSQYDLTIYCEAKTQPAGWDPQWNVKDFSTWPFTYFNTVWGVAY